MTADVSSNPLGYTGINLTQNPETLPLAFRVPGPKDIYPINTVWPYFNNGTVSLYASLGGGNWSIQESIGDYPVTSFTVGALGKAGYQTIQAAINAANLAGGGIIIVQPGTYTENLTLQSYCHIAGLTLADAGGGVTIVGEHIPPVSGGFVFNNVALNSSTNIFNSTAAGSTHLIIANAAITVTNGYTFNLPNWTGKLETFDVNDRNSTTDGYVNNTGGSEIAIFSAAVGAGTANPMIVSGSVTIFTCDVGCPLNFHSGSVFFLEENVHTESITFSGNSTGEVLLSEIDAQVIMSSSGTVLLSNCLINTSASPAIAGSGSGSFGLGDLTFVSNSSVAGTLNPTWIPTSTGSLNSTGNVSAIGGQIFAGGDNAGVASTVSLTNSNSSTISTGTGTVQMSTANNATNSAWIKIYVGTVAHWIPAWTTNAP